MKSFCCHGWHWKVWLTQWLSDHSLLYLELLSQLKIIFSIDEFYVDACPGEYVTDTANMIWEAFRDKNSELSTSFALLIRKMFYWICYKIVRTVFTYLKSVMVPFITKRNFPSGFSASWKTLINFNKKKRHIKLNFLNAFRWSGTQWRAEVRQSCNHHLITQNEYLYDITSMTF